MRGSCGCIRRSPAPARRYLTVASRTTTTVSKPQLIYSSALARPYGTSNTSNYSGGISQSSNKDTITGRQEGTGLHGLGSLSQSTGWDKDEPLGQGNDLHNRNVLIRSRWNTTDLQIIQTLRATQESLRTDDPTSWERILLAMRHKHGNDGIWAVFESIQAQGCLAVLIDKYGEVLRDEILSVALQSDQRLADLVEVAQQLFVQDGVEWPELYMRTLHHFLEKAEYDQAIRWHIQLAPKFLPGEDVLGALIASFAVNPTPQMQSCLTTLYVFSTKFQLYDYVIPTLFLSGQSKLARTWRKKFLLFKDNPTKRKSRPFIRFLASYYPAISLSKEELDLAGLQKNHGGASYRQADRGQPLNPTMPRGLYSDAIVARWFASSWTSVEFAINLVHRLGLQTIGPRSLQSLALRETDAKGVAARVAQLQKLGVGIPNQVYCKVLVAFARGGEDKLLNDLLDCDIHPDEFDDIETRQMLMAAAVKDGNWRRERLFQGIEWAIETGPSAQKLNSLLANELSMRRLGQARVILDRMEAMKVHVAQSGATLLLSRVFWGLGEHPTKKERTQSMEQSSSDSHLNRAIDVVRRIALHDVAIPHNYWRILLYNLGRLGRADELEQLSLEIVQLYTPPYGGLVPVHRDDMPLTLDARIADGEKPSRNQSSISQNQEESEGSSSIEPVFDKNFRGEAKKLASTEPMDPLDILTLKMTQLRRGSDKDVKPKSPEPKQNIPDTADQLKRSSQLKSSTSNTPNVTNQPQKSTKTAPRSKTSKPASKQDMTAATKLYDAKEKEYIPADLPFSHREHPVQKIFDPHLQRSIVRWAFDGAVAAGPNRAPRSLSGKIATGSSDYELASGVRLLAMLRDRGVLIDTQVLRSTVVARMAIGQLPGRRKNRGWDNNQLSAQNVKRLVNAAWGQELFPREADLEREVDKQKPKLWGRYTKLLTKAFDRKRIDGPEQ